MSSWVSRSLERAISLITEMIRPSKDIILQKHFDELHDILMDTAKDIVIKMENLEKHRDLIKGECLLLEKMNALSESDKLKFHDELQKSQKECQELKEKLARLRESKIVSDLNEKIGKLKSQILDRDHKVGLYQQNLKFSEKRVAELEKGLQDLKDKKLAADKIIGEMRHKQIEANHMMDELRRQNLEASETTKKLRCQMLAAEMEKTRYEEMMKQMKHKQFEADQTLEKLRSRNLEACDVIEGLRNSVLSFEVDKRRSDQTVMEMKRKQMETDQIVDDLTPEHLDSFRTIEEVKSVIVKKSMKAKEAKDANTRVFKGENQNLENGSSISTERVHNGSQKIGKRKRKRKLIIDDEEEENAFVVFNDKQKKASDDVEAKKVQKKRKQVVFKDGKEKKFETSCNPSKISHLVSKLNDKQRADVISIGFGGLLHLKINNYLPTGLMPYLVSTFDGKLGIQSIGNYRYYVTVYDVADIFGLPYNTKRPVNRVSKGCKDDPLRIRWQEALGKVHDGITITKLPDLILNLTKGGDEFKRYFVMYAVCTLLAPLVTTCVDVGLLGAIEDVSSIKNQDWCQFIFERMSSGVDRYNSKPNAKSCNGCLLVLLLAYMHRFPTRGLSEPRELPLVQHWTAEKLKERVRIEKASGKYGSLIMNADVYPISSTYLHVPVAEEARPKQPSTIDKRASISKVLLDAVLDSGDDAGVEPISDDEDRR